MDSKNFSGMRLMRFSVAVWLWCLASWCASTTALRNRGGGGGGTREGLRVRGESALCPSPGGSLRRGGPRKGGIAGVFAHALGSPGIFG